MVPGKATWDSINRVEPAIKQHTNEVKVMETAFVAGDETYKIVNTLL